MDERDRELLEGAAHGISGATMGLTNILIVLISTLVEKQVLSEDDLRECSTGWTKPFGMSRPRPLGTVWKRK